VSFAILHNIHNYLHKCLYFNLSLETAVSSIYFDSTLMMFMALNEEENGINPIAYLHLLCLLLTCVWYVKPLVPAAFAGVYPLHFQGGLTTDRRPVIQVSCQIPQLDEKVLYRLHLVGYGLRISNKYGTALK
jgi:hypothetical protein